ncbi:sugar phosphorylase [Vreelandella aquamarina]|uniref:sugar phosphorylase n=1 Tax=Vreelandella aquamarina TaxID=77097 RepID=UPI00385097F5
MPFHPSRITPLDAATFDRRAGTHLKALYGPRAEEVLRRLYTLLEHQSPRLPVETDAPLWSEKDQWLICYGSSLQDADAPPLAVLKTFLDQHLAESFSGVHLLPFFPWSSDDGFSVIHYREVDPALGDWPQVRELAEYGDLAVDLVLNHVSRESLWFVDYLTGSQPGRDYFHEMDPQTDLSAVVRPRSSPLLVPIATRRGTRYLWATFSDDQIDLNFANPDVLLEFIGILLFYLQQGARIIRLDAIAYLWKKVGTDCIHLPETHEVVRLLRAVVDHVAPGTLLLTETNVPHTENISYFGLDRVTADTPADEAHLVYQFPLPPLLLHSLTSGEAGTLASWLKSLPELPPGCSFLNFTASHDGIGVRPLEGWLAPHEVEALTELMHRFGGFVSMRRHPDGSDSPYEINITWFDAMKGTRRGPDHWQVPRFLCGQQLMLGLQGIPAMYIHTLTGTLNDLEGVERSGRLRSINRRRWQRDELERLLSTTSTTTHDTFAALKQLLAVRRNEPCFHPDAGQQVLETPASLLAFERGPLNNGRRLLAIHNVTDLPQPLDALALTLADRYWQDIVSKEAWPTTQTTLAPYGVLWLMTEGE